MNGAEVDKLDYWSLQMVRNCPLILPEHEQFLFADRSTADLRDAADGSEPRSFGLIVENLNIWSLASKHHLNDTPLSPR